LNFGKKISSNVHLEISVGAKKFFKIFCSYNRNLFGCIWQLKATRAFILPLIIIIHVLGIIINDKGDWTMKFRVEQSANVVPHGLHTAKITEIKYGESQYGKTIKFLFAIQDVDGEPIISGMASAEKLTPMTKLYKWLLALNGGGAIPVNADIEPEIFVGKGVKIFVENTEKNGAEYSNVKDILCLDSDLDDIPF
jgi:hypothetical protein